MKLLFSFADPVGTASRQLHEFGVTGMVRVCEAITGHRVRPVRVELRHDTACPMLARHLGLPVAVYQPHSALVLDAASLTAPVVNADARLLDLLRRYADDLLARRARKDDLVARAERWILENLHTGDVGVARLARGLGMSDRTLSAALGRGRAHAGWPRRGPAPAARQQVPGGARVSARAHHLPARLQRPQRVHSSVSAVDRPYAIEVAGGAVAHAAAALGTTSTPVESPERSCRSNELPYR